MSAALLALLVAAAPAGRVFTLDPARSTLRYHVVHRFHDVTGVSSSLEGRAVVQADGRVLAMVRAPIASFDSGERNRDAHMREATAAARFPFVVFKGIAPLGEDALAAARTGAVEARMEGEVELRGVKAPVPVVLSVAVEPDGTVRARGRFTLSLERFGVERPSLLFVRIDDACRVEVDLALREVPP